MNIIKVLIIGAFFAHCGSLFNVFFLTKTLGDSIGVSFNHRGIASLKRKLSKHNVRAAVKRDRGMNRIKPIQLPFCKSAKKMAPM